MNTDKHGFKGQATKADSRTSHYFGKQTVRALLLGGFLISLVVFWFRLWSGPVSVSGVPWAVWLLIILAAATTVAALTRELPTQSVVLASAVIAMAGAVGGTFGKLATVKLMDQASAFGSSETRLGLALWETSMMWVVMILNARGVAKLLLRRWRRAPNYGFWVLGGTMLLVMGLETSAVAINQCSGSTSHTTADQWSKTWAHLAVWTVMALVILAVVTPVLINKSVVDRAPAAQPLIVWFAINFLVLTSAALLEVWWAVGVVAGEMALISFCAMRSSKCSRSR